MLNYLHKSNNVEVHESVLHIVLHQRQQTMHEMYCLVPPLHCVEEGECEEESGDTAFNSLH